MITSNQQTLYSANIEKEKLVKSKPWTEIISPRTSLFDLRLGELWRYRDLVMMFVKRDFVSNYKQTILGPIWFILQPLLTTVTFMIIFGRIAKLSTEGIPMMLFYLSGITIWNFFSDSLNKTATVFKDNAQMFGKIYFPRLTMPASIVISNLVKFGIQFALFLGVWVYFLLKKENVHPNGYVALVPLLLLLMGLMALGLGMIISAMTTKYRDLSFLLSFGVQLLMYATPVVYPISQISDKYKWIVMINPLSAILETFRYSFLGSGTFSWTSLCYTSAFTLIILITGVIVFNKVEKTFTDTV